MLALVFSYPRQKLRHKQETVFLSCQPTRAPSPRWLQFQLRWTLYTPVENTSHCNVTIAYEQITSLLLKRNIVQPYPTLLFECKYE